MRTPDEGRSPAEEAAARTAAYRAAIEMVAWGEHHGNVPRHLRASLFPRRVHTVTADSRVGHGRPDRIHHHCRGALLGLLYDPIRLAETWRAGPRECGR